MIYGLEQRCPFFWGPGVAKYKLGIGVCRLTMNVQDVIGGHLVDAGQRAGVIERQVGGVDVQSRQAVMGAPGVGGSEWC